MSVSTGIRHPLWVVAWSVKQSLLVVIATLAGVGFVAGQEHVDPQQILRDYVAAWNEDDASTRGEMLARSFADDGIYTDPTAWVAGRSALVEHIGGFLSASPGSSLSLIEEPELHHGHGRFEWSLRTAAGEEMVRGVDFVTFAPDGRIAKIVGFF